jgi:hypothetical protein
VKNRRNIKDENRKIKINEKKMKHNKNNRGSTRKDNQGKRIIGL